MNAGRCRVCGSTLLPHNLLGWVQKPHRQPVSGLTSQYSYLQPLLKKKEQQYDLSNIAILQINLEELFEY